MRLRMLVRLPPRGSAELPLNKDETLQLAPDSRNTLFPLTEGMRVLADVCEAILEGDRSQYRRSSDDLPFWAVKSEIVKFPFEHTVPLLDVAAEERESVVETLRNVPRTLARGNTLDVRNRLEHNRDPFPTRAEIETALNAVEEVVGRMEESGVCPLLCSCMKELCVTGTDVQWPP